jgi:alkaline phosphatase D
VVFLSLLGPKDQIKTKLIPWMDNTCLSRRAFVGVSASLLASLPGKAPARITRDARRPRMSEGIAIGDPSIAGAIVWSRTDRPARLHVEWSTYSDFRNRVHALPQNALEVTDYTARTSLRGLPNGADIFYRVTFEDLSTGARSAPQDGQFRTPSIDKGKTTRFAWSGDVGGQGFGINPKIGGMTIFQSILDANPDLFIHCGDVVYSDAPLRAKKRVGTEQTWHNIIVPEKRKVAESVAEFRGQFRYNLIDENLKRFNAKIPTAYLWDDHETKNNWWPGRMLSDRRYSVRSCDLLAARAKHAFFEYCPMARKVEAPGRIYRRLSQGPNLDVFMTDTRSHRGSNTLNRQEQSGPQAAFFGAAQLSWLCQELERSTATWKVIACPQPLSLLIAHAGFDFDGAANGRGGRPRGRELEVAKILNFIKRKSIKNVVWITADVHYAAAHRYDPNRAAYKDFEPFWEFVAGPLNAGTFGPNPLDPTFGPKVEFLSIPKSLRPGRSPLDGFQFFGMGEVNSESKTLTVSLHRLDGKKIWSTDIRPSA